MSLSASWVDIPVVYAGTYYPSKEKLAGKRIVVEPLSLIVADDEAAVPKRYTFELDANGELTGATLPSTTNGDVGGVYYRVTEKWTGARDPFNILVLANAAEVNLATEAPVVDADLDLVSVLGLPAVAAAQAAQAGAEAAQAAAESAADTAAADVQATLTASVAASAQAASTAATAAATSAQSASDSAAAAGSSSTAAAASAASAATAAATAVAYLAVQPETYGAIGNGSTDDSDALLSAIATGKNISLRAGKIYLVSKPLVLAVNQCLNGNGATLKRANQATTTTTTGITNATTNSLTVASAASFRVGQKIAVYNGANYSTDAPVIQSIVGNVITTATSFHLSAGSPWSGTTTVAHAYDVLNVEDGGVVEKLNIDGNRANWTKYRWETSVEIGMSGAGTIRDVILQNCPSDAIIEHEAGLNPTYENIRVLNGNGNGLHLSGSTNPVVRGFWGKNLNLDTAVGHADGGIILSNGVKDAVIDSFYIENAISGVASFDSAGNSDLTITNGVIRSCTGTAMEGTFPSGEGANNILISNIRIYDSVKLDINQTSGGSSVFPSRWHLSNVYLENTALYIANARNIELDQVSVNFGTATTGTIVTIAGSKNINYNSGIVTGGSAAIYITGSTSERVKIGAGVRVLTPNGYGVYFNSGVGADCVAQGVQVYMDASAAASCYGVLQAAGTLAQDCVIRMDHGVGIQQNESNCLTIGNTIRQASGTSIKNFGGSSGCIAINNLISAAVSNGGGASNTFSGNTTIPA